MRPRSADPRDSAFPEVTTVDLSGSRTGSSYLLMEPIGGGGTGRVWRALDRGNGDQVAVKLLHRELMSEPKAVTRFIRERSILLMLEHRNIVRVRDLLTIGESLGLVMDLVRGGSLHGYLRRHGTLPPASAAAILAQVAEALVAAHQLGIVHRDLKPDNVLIDPARTPSPAGMCPAADLAGIPGPAAELAGIPGPAADLAGAPGSARPAEPHVRLTDFGIARLLDSPGLTTPQALIGTPNYLAPEVITGAPPSPAVDVYAMGVLLYELLLGRPPYTGGPVVAVLRRHLDCEPHRHPGIPDEAWHAVLACMAKNPAERPSAGALVTTMRALASRTADQPAAQPAPVPPHWAQAADGPLIVPGGRSGDGPAARPAGRPGAPRHAQPGRSLPRQWRPLAMLVLTGALVTMFGTMTGDLPGWLTTALPGGGPTVSAPPPAQVEDGRVRRAPLPPSPAASASAVPTAPTERAAQVEPSRRRTEAGQRRPAAPRVRVRAKVYGELNCADKYVWDVGHPAVALPCHAAGPKIRMVGRLQALPGVQADVSLSLQDVESGRTVAGPHTCVGLRFTDFSREHTCGPFYASPPAGRRYAVVERWVYTGQSELPAGTAVSEPFPW